MEIEQERFLDQVTEWLKKIYSKQLDIQSQIEITKKNPEFKLINDKQNLLSDGFHNFPILGNVPEQLPTLKLEKISFQFQLQNHKLDLTAELIFLQGISIKIIFNTRLFLNEKAFLEIYDKFRIKALRESLDKQPPLNLLKDNIIFPQIHEPLNLKQVWPSEGQFITEQEAQYQQKQLKEEKKSVLNFLTQKKKVRQIEKEMLIHGKPTQEPKENLQSGLRQELGEQSAQLKEKIENEQKKREKEVQEQEEKIQQQAPDIPEEEVKQLREFVQFYKENDIDMRANIDSHKRDISQVKGAQFEEDRQLLKKRPYIGMGVDYQKKQENLRTAMEQQQQAQPIYDPIDMLNVPLEVLPKQQINNQSQMSSFPNTNRNSFLDTDISYDIIQRERQKKKMGGMDRAALPKQKKEAQKEVNIDQFKGLQFDLNTIQELKEQKQMNN